MCKSKQSGRNRISIAGQVRASKSGRQAFDKELLRHDPRWPRYFRTVPPSFECICKLWVTYSAQQDRIHSVPRAGVVIRCGLPLTGGSVSIFPRIRMGPNVKEEATPRSGWPLFSS
jgi:hypothetical protein